MSESTPQLATWHLTGNHYVAIPCIAPKDGAIHRINVLHRGLLGLVEWAAERDPAAAGEPLLAPRVRIDGEPAPLGILAWEPLDRWIPRFRSVLPGGVRLEATLCAPIDAGVSVRGVVYRFEVENASAEEHEVEIALEGAWRWSLRTVRTSRPLSTENGLYRAGNPAGVVLEPGGPVEAAALAVLAGAESAHYGAAEGDADFRELAAGDEVSVPNGAALRLRAAQSVRVPGRGRAAVAFYLGAAPERDGALATASALKRTGAGELVRATRLELARLARRTRDPARAALLNRNLLFNHFFAVGRSVDDDRLYPLASRSPRYPEGGLVRERDALYWTLPAMTLADPPLARELLLRVFEQYSHNAGESAHYLDGGVLAPGFALDQACAYVLALDRYVREADDPSVLDVPLVQEVLRELDARLFHRLHPEILLCATDVLPSGEPPRHPYATFGNVLLWAVCTALPRVWIAHDDRDTAHFAGSADDLAAAIWRYATVDVEGSRVLVGSTDLKGEAAIYDDPAGSLALLPFLGFCDTDDPIWRNTMDLLHSNRYPFWLADRPFPGMAGRAHPASASTLSLCAGLLGSGRDQALDLLLRLPLDDGYACESYDPETGLAATGPHFAAAAGLLAWSLWYALEE